MSKGITIGPHTLEEAIATERSLRLEAPVHAERALGEHVPDMVRALGAAWVAAYETPDDGPAAAENEFVARLDALAAAVGHRDLAMWLAMSWLLRSDEGEQDQRPER